MKQSMDKLNSVFEDPWKELAYRVLERACLDARGKEMCLPLDQRTVKNRLNRMDEAKSWFGSPAYELFCDGLEINPDKMREKLMKARPSIEMIEQRNEEIKKMCLETELSSREIAEKFGVSKFTILKIIKGLADKRVQAIVKRDKEILRMRLSGMKEVEIAKKVGLSEQRVSGIIRRDMPPYYRVRKIQNNQMIL